MDRTPTRTAATWTMDANVKQGVKKGGYGPEEAQSGDTVGDACPEVERVNGDLQREWMKQQQMMVTNMHTKPEDQDGCIFQRWHERDGGATFQQWDGGRTRLDYGIILKDRLKRVTTREVFAVSPSLRSRVGAVRLQRRGGGGYDLLLGGMSWATDKAKQKESSINKMFRRWASEGTDRISTRSAVIWMMDVNAKLGVKKSVFGPEKDQSGDTGRDVGTELENVKGGLHREGTNEKQLMAMNTYTRPEDQDECILQRRHERDGGATFRRWDGGRSRLDHTIIPKDILKRAVKIVILYTSAHSLQLAKCTQLRELQPLALQEIYCVCFDEGEKKRGVGLDANKKDDTYQDEKCGVG